MSIYGYLLCHTCRESMWLGKAIQESNRVLYFHVGQPDDPSNWQRAVLNQALWKFVADHSSHRIVVTLENDMTDEFYSYRAVGSHKASEEDDLTQYVSGWPGLSRSR